MLVAKLLALASLLVVLGGVAAILLLRRRIARDEARSTLAKEIGRQKEQTAEKNARDIVTIARREALRGFHGALCGLESNLSPVLSRFEKDLDPEADWSAAFVCHCARLAGYPARQTDEGEELSDAEAWETWGLERDLCLLRGQGEMELCPGDLVILSDPPGHMGVVLECDEGSNRFTAAEGCVGGVSAVVERPNDRRVHARIRLKRPE